MTIEEMNESEHLCPYECWGKLGKYLAEHIARYAFAIDVICKDEDQGRKRILDVACGDGYGTKLLDCIAADVFGMDYDPSAIETARAHFSLVNGRYEQGDLDEMVPDGLWDAVVSFETMEHLKKPQIFLQRVASRLTSDGVLVGSLPVNCQTKFHKTVFPDLSSVRNFVLEAFGQSEFYGQDGWRITPTVDSTSRNILFVCREPRQ